MSDIGKVRLRVPTSIKAGDVVRVRSLIIHPMERIERDAQGKIIEKNYNYINKVIVTYLGKTVAVVRHDAEREREPVLRRSPSRRPTRASSRSTFLDTTGGKFEGTADVKFS